MRGECLLADFVVSSTLSLSLISVLCSSVAAIDAKVGQSLERKLKQAEFRFHTMP